MTGRTDLATALPRPLGFVLGGGGSLGAVQVGMLLALAEQDLVPDLVVGTSVGAWNGVVVALDPKTAPRRLGDIWPQITRQMVFPGGPLAQLRTLQQEKTHLFPNTGLRAVLHHYLPRAATFADLSLPFAAVTMDVATTAPHVLLEGPLEPALLASAAIPGIFPAVQVEERRLYDGGVVANVPLMQALHLGARSLVVLDAAFPGRLPTPPETLAEALLFTAVVTMRVQATLEAPYAATQVPVVYLPGPEIQRVSPLEFDHTALLLEGGYQEARAFLETVQVAGPGLYGSPSGR
ncbi:patatin-like phospholipase family protein [Nocardioides mesophilus]|uniref:Patatin-like phospholipase family protein n=1 Tax=Nocardioides mesophilus TaxID=433659 RepID=A0A7G9R8C5_9ACTN|nr:patatin-like phospholipase family protein [Nocardioides mesophilus]QNN51850.1 patatin-like phospholipase family protein [Nocardioides mesophilus]